MLMAKDAVTMRILSILHFEIFICEWSLFVMHIGLIWNVTYLFRTGRFCIFVLHCTEWCHCSCQMGADTPGSRHPREQTPPGSRHPPGADTPPWSRHPPWDTATAADGTHPTGMHSCYFKPIQPLQIDTPNNVCWFHLLSRMEPFEE